MGIDLTDAPPVLGPVQPSPARRPGSVRRTATMDVTWPEGYRGAMRVLGRARDLLTPSDASNARVLAEDVLHADVRADRTIEALSSEPARHGLDRLIGARGGGRLRGLLVEALPDEVASGTCLNLLLDDLSGVSLVAGFAFMQWPNSRPEEFYRRARAEAGKGGSGTKGGSEGMRRGPREGVCVGFSPGSSALTRVGQGTYREHLRPVADLGTGADELGWHRLEQIGELSMRRARRLDVWVGDDIEAEVFFQDSSTTPSRQRVAVHEYRVFARAELATGVLTDVAAEARVLPHDECPLAVRNVDRMVGTPVEALRDEVPHQLKGTLGCTHLNDVLRSLADLRRLARPLAAALA